MKSVFLIVMPALLARTATTPLRKTTLARFSRSLPAVLISSRICIKKRPLFALALLLCARLAGAQAAAPSCYPTSGAAPRTVTCTNPNSGVTFLCYNFTGSPASNSARTGCATGSTIYPFTGGIPITTSETLYVIAAELAHGVTQSNIDDDTPGAWPTHSTGWKSICILPDCNPGGTVPPTSTSWTIDNTSPSLDGYSMNLSLTSPAGMKSTDNAEVLITYIAGKDENSTTFLTNVHFYAGANIAKANAVEMDQFSFSTTRNEELMLAHECVLGSYWQIWYGGSSPHWVNTDLACSGTTGLPASTWTWVTYNDYIVPGDTRDCSGYTCMHFGGITINDTPYPITCGGDECVEPAQTLPEGWASGIGMQVQLDIPYNGGSAETVDAYYDEVLFVSYDAIPDSSVVSYTYTAP